jgi:transcriptional regulator with XRE-family HTH domain
MREQENFASRLTNLIHEQGVSHAEVGRVVGVSGQAVGKWAKGGNIEYDNLQALAQYFGVNWVWLRYGDDAITAFSERRTGSKARRAVIKNIMENEERQRLALDAASIGTWDLDLVADNLVLSDVAYQLLHVEPGTFHGDKAELLNCVDTDERDQVKSVLTQVLDNKLDTFDITHRLADSDVRLRHRGKVIKDDMDRPVRVVCVINRVENL